MKTSFILYRIINNLFNLTLILSFYFASFNYSVFAQCSSAIPFTFNYDPYNNQAYVGTNGFGYNTYQLYNKAVENESSSNAG